VLVNTSCVAILAFAQFGVDLRAEARIEYPPVHCVACAPARCAALNIALISQ
jgi:hypothetical protein